MKLHLPKNLFLLALAMTMTQPLLADGEAGTDITTEYNPDEEIMVIATLGDGNIKTSPDGASVLDVGLGTSSHKWDTSITVGSFGDKTGDVDAIGAVTEQNMLIDSSTLGANTYTNTLQVNGSVTLLGDGQIILGGKQSSKQYGGLIASSVTVGTPTKAEGESPDVEKDNPSLFASMTNIATLTVNSGTVALGGGSDCYTGGSSLSETNKKLAQITNSLVVNGGTVTLGQYHSSYYNADHAQTAFGSYGLASGFKSASISQSAGTMIAKGYTLMVSGLSISQTGGTMNFEDPMAFFGDRSASATTIYQNGSQSTKLIINGMEVATNWAVSAAKPDKMAVNITQDGAGTIEFNKGISINTSAVGQIQQNANGTILLNGTYNNKFNISQNGNGGNIKLGIDSNGNAVAAKVTAGTVTQNQGTLTVGESASLSATSIKIAGTLENNGTINKTDGNSLLEIVGGKVENNGTIAMDILMYDGELTATNGRTFASITAKEGVITISGTVNITGELILGNATMVSTFSANSTEGKVVVNLLDAKSGINLTDIDNLALGKDVVFNVMVDSLDDLKANDTLTIFNLVDNKNNETVNITQQITVTDKDGNEKVVTYTDKGNGSVTVNAVVPEPTTATLSLLALAALASRRRRK